MIVEYIEVVIEVFVQVVVDVKVIGMDGIEIYGVYGYLIDQFFWEGMNQCIDSWGGNMVNCGCFVVEIIKVICVVMLDDFLIVLCYF